MGGGVDAVSDVSVVAIPPVDNTMHGFELRSKLEGGLGLDVIEVSGRERVKLNFGVVELIRLAIGGW